MRTGMFESKARWVLAIFLALAYLALGGLALPSPDVAASAILQVPYGYFEIPLPEGWHYLSLEHLAERQYFFTPEPVTQQQLQEGVDLGASFQIRILALDVPGLGSPVATMLQEDLAHRIQIYRDHGVTLEGRPAGPEVIAGIEGETALLSQEDDEEFLFLGRKGHLLYEIDYAYKREQKDRYLPVLQQMAAGLRLLTPETPGEAGVFRDTNGSFSAELPADWYPMGESEPEAQFFVSRERMMSTTDAFTVGACFRKVPGLSQRLSNYRLSTDWEAVAFWTSVVTREQKGLEQKILAIRSIPGEIKAGVVLERSYRFESAPYYVQELHLIRVRDDTLYEVILEAPVMEFELYRPVFDRAIQTLQLR